MEYLAEHIDVIVQAPLAIIVLVFIYLHNSKTNKMIENYHKIIEKLIDKLK